MQVMFERARDALAFLEHQRLEPTVPHYGLALIHLTGGNAALSREIAGLIGDGFRLTATDAARMIARYVPLPVPTGIADHAERLGSLADEARAVTRTAGANVGDLVREAQGALPSGDETVQRLAAAENELAMLRQQFEMLKKAMVADVRRAIDPEHDPLTSALKPAFAGHVLDQIDKHDRRHVIVMHSIDGLVEINREFGTSVGDNVLNGFAAKIQKQFPEQEVIRWAGNEFIVVVPDRTITAVRSQAEDVLSLLESRKFKLAETGEWIGTVTASGAVVMDQGDDFPAMLGRARETLAGAVAAGGNRVAV